MNSGGYNLYNIDRIQLFMDKSVKWCITKMSFDYTINSNRIARKYSHCFLSN